MTTRLERNAKKKLTCRQKQKLQIFLTDERVHLPGRQRKGHELKWKDIAEGDREAFRQSEQAEWDKWMKHQAVEIIPP